MTYDPFTGEFGDDDGVSFPFDIPVMEDDGNDEGEPIILPGGDIPSGTVGAISYDRGDNEIVAGPVSVDRSDDVRTPRGPTRIERERAERAQERAAADTGNRNVRGASTGHAGADRAGSNGGPGGLAGSVREAADRLRAQLGEPASGSTGVVAGPTATLEPGVNPALEKYLTQVAIGAPQPGHKLIPPNRGAGETRKAPTEPAEIFDRVEFNCEVYKIGTNAAGDWMVTFKIPFADRNAIVALSAAYGMNLQTTMVGHGYTV